MSNLIKRADFSLAIVKWKETIINQLNDNLKRLIITTIKEQFIIVGQWRSRPLLLDWPTTPERKIERMDIISGNTIYTDFRII